MFQVLAIVRIAQSSVHAMLAGDSHHERMSRIMQTRTNVVSPNLPSVLECYLLRPIVADSTIGRRRLMKAHRVFSVPPCAPPNSLGGRGRR